MGIRSKKRRKPTGTEEVQARKNYLAGWKHTGDMMIRSEIPKWKHRGQHCPGFSLVVVKRYIPGICSTHHEWELANTWLVCSCPNCGFKTMPG